MHNRVLLSLEPEARAFLEQGISIRALDAGDVLYDEGQGFREAIFPHLGVISVLAAMADGRSVEKASIGNEGFIGLGYLMGSPGAMGRMVVQIPGYASFVPVEHMELAMAEFAGLREAMLRYARTLIVHLMETVACNSMHGAERRIVSWLLQADDRMLGQEFSLTQEALSHVLGLRRATVSEIYSELARAGLISYSRGVVNITDRVGLRRRACECYERIAAARLAPGAATAD